MEYRFRMMQSDLRTLYESAQARIDAHPEIAEKHREVVEKCRFFKTEKEALKAAIAKIKDNNYGCQIWAKVEKDGDIFRVLNYWLVIDDGKMKQSADYIGMALMYDETRLQTIIDNNVPIDDVIAYY